MSPSFSLDGVDFKHWGLMLGSLLGAVILSFFITTVLPALQGNWALVSLALTPVLHIGLLWLKNNDSGNQAKPLIDALPGSPRS